MGRRALRKINPQLDYSRWLCAVDDAPAPFDAAAEFGRQAPLEVEIGSGKGLFIRRASQDQPSHDFVGIEIAGRYARYAASRLAHDDRTNALMLHGDGLKFFREHLTAGAVRAVHVYFPDPWWKKRHRKRRVMTNAFIADIERVLEPQGRLHFWTDVEEYFQSTLELIASCSSLEGPLPVQESPAEHDLDYRTHFERRMRLHDDPVYRSEYVKASGKR